MGGGEGTIRKSTETLNFVQFWGRWSEDPSSTSVLGLFYVAEHVAVC